VKWTLRNVSKHYEKYKTVEELQVGLGLSSKAATMDWIKKNVPLESYYQKKIIQYLRRRFPKAVVWKETNGVYCSMNGIPDISMVKDGKYYGFEVKRPFIGKLSAIQEATIAALSSAGAKVYVVTYISDINEALNLQG
jgi:hypothetical protein